MDKIGREFILNILDTAKDLSIATNRQDGYPQVTTTSFVHDGLTIYIAIGPASQKARNITRDHRVSLVVDVPYSGWNDIRGISMAADAHLVDDDGERQKAGELMTERFGALMREMPQSDVATAMMEATFLRIRPKVVSLLDYTKGFGHTELVEVAPADFAAG